MTLNVPNGLLIGRRMVPPLVIDAQRPMLAAAARASGSTQFVGGPSFGFVDQMQPQMLAAHRLGRQAIKAAWPKLPVGVALAMIDDQASGPGSLRDAMRQEFYGDWFAAARGDDFIGVQNYSRVVWDANGKFPPPAGAVLNDEGEEIHPASLANAVRYAHQSSGCPVLVTEHGVPSANDALRVALIPQARAELQRAMDAGTPVLGYMHWSLLDNFEWVSGCAPCYGLAAVDRSNFKRMLKPSAAVLGGIARNKAL